MARSVNQSIAWVAATFLSLLVFSLGLAMVFSLQPRRKDIDSHGSGHGLEHASEDTHGSPASAETSQAAETHAPGKPAEHATEKTESHGKAQGEPGDEDEKEISASSMKAKAHGQVEHEEAVPEAKPHH